MKNVWIIGVVSFLSMLAISKDTDDIIRHIIGMTCIIWIPLLLLLIICILALIFYIFEDPEERRIRKEKEARMAEIDKRHKEYQELLEYRKRGWIK